jgi:DNA-3-methyladenine glycosylase II
VTETFTIVPRGPFSLAEAIGFGFGQRDAAAGDDVMRLAFCLDGYEHQVGVEVRQDEAGVHGTVRAPASAGLAGAGGAGAGLDAVRDQVARVLSLDYDAAGFLEAGQRDPVLGSVQRAAPGLRPPLFYSPYEAAAWAVLSMRRPARQMMAVRDRLGHAHGAVFDLAGQRLAALPTPAQLLGLTSFPGIPPDRMQRLHGVARAAQEGRLDASHLLGLGPEEAMVRVREIPGIGPFYSALIVIRATGFADVLPDREPNLLALVERLYQRQEPVSGDELRVLAEPWRPFRTWAAVLIRAAAARVLGGGEAGQARTNPDGRRRRIGSTVAIGAVSPHRAETVRS